MPGVVDQHVDAAELPPDAPAQGVGVRRVGEIRRQRDRRPTAALDE
jgi:hypothetical protein